MKKWVRNGKNLCHFTPTSQPLPVFFQLRICYVPPPPKLGTETLGAPWFPGSLFILTIGIIPPLLFCTLLLFMYTSLCNVVISFLLFLKSLNWVYSTYPSVTCFFCPFWWNSFISKHCSFSRLHSTSLCEPILLFDRNSVQQIYTFQVLKKCWLTSHYLQYLKHTDLDLNGSSIIIPWHT